MSNTCFHCTKEYLGPKNKCVLCKRKVLCVSCWNGSKTCVIEASQCKTITAEILGGPLLVPTTVVGDASMPVVVEQPTAAPLTAKDGSLERVAEEEKQREVEKIAVDERQRDAVEKKEAEEEKMRLAEEKQQSEEAEEKKEVEEQKRQELEEGKEQVDDHQTELEKSEIFRAGIVGATLRHIVYTKPNREHGIQDVIEEQLPIEWSFYALYEGVDPRKRQDLALANKPPLRTDWVECRVFACLTEGLEDRCLFIWLPTNEGNLIIEEIVSEAIFNNFKDFEPFLLWLKGSASKPSVEEEKDCDGTVASLNSRNNDAIKEALSSQKLPSENVSDDMSALTAISIMADDSQLVVAAADPHISGVQDGPADERVEEGPIFPTTPIFAALNSGSDQGAFDRDGDEEITVFTASLPPRILEDEKKLVGFLSILNDKKSKILSRELDVGGNLLTLQTFHYPASNLVAPRNAKQQTFIDASDMPLLFSYEFKAACTVVVRQANKKFAARAFISYCQLEYIPDSADDKKFTRYQLILIGILTTLCVTARNDFLVLDRNLNQVMLWQKGMQFMRNCYCNRSIPVDKTFLKSKRNEYFGTHSWWYNPSRGISRNHQTIGNYDVQFKSADHLNETAKWTAMAGKRGESPSAVLSPAPVTQPLHQTSSSTDARKKRHDKAKVDRERKEDIVDIAYTPAKKATTPVVKPVFTTVVSPQPVSIKAASSYLKPPSVPKSSISCANEESYSHQQYSIQLSSIHTLKHEGDVIAERLRQEARLKLLAAEQESQMEIQAIKLEESKQIAQRDLFRQQSLINDEKEAVFKAQKARKELEQSRLDEDYDYNTGLKRRKAEVSLSQDAMRFNAQFQYDQAVAKQSLQEREDAHDDARNQKRFKLKKNMIEYSMDGQHSRSMEIIAEKTHFLQSSSRLQMASSSEQHEESSMMVRHSSSSQQHNSSTAVRRGRDPDEDDVDEEEEDLKAFFKGSSKK